MEASGQRQATKAGSIHAWVAYCKCCGNDDGNTMETGIMISLGRCCQSDALCLSHILIPCFSSLVFKKRCLAGVIAVAVAIVSLIYSLASSERVVH